MGLLPQRLGEPCSKLALGTVICQFHPPADSTKGTHRECHLKVAQAHERRRGESKIVFVENYDLMRLWHEVGWVPT